MTRAGLILFFFVSCGVWIPRHAFRMAQENQKHVDQIRMGQTLAEVERIMGKPPERRSARLRFDGLSIEEWSYLTDYVRKMDTIITFVGGKVEEIRSAPWEDEDEDGKSGQ
ncbi:MAG TPA: hypothetical protein VMU84_15620 [Thermoanaerobaculia bacterium]|nr:hypothetical protein [Thermoanaerobaculia bacterium]